jgi:adenylate cyclase
VDGLSNREVAQRAGVEPAYVAKLVGFGVLAPNDGGNFTEGDVRRVRLYQGLERTGLPLEAIREALEAGQLSFGWLDNPLYDLIAPLSPRSFEDVALDTGIPIDVLRVLREAIGFALPEPDDRMREDELRVVPILQMLIARGIPASVLDQLLRVYGDSLRRIAEVEADWWHRYIVLPSLAAGKTEVEMHEETLEVGVELAPLLEQSVLAMYHAHQEHTWVENLIGEIEDALDRAGLRTRLIEPPAICFLDITGYTRLTEEHGDEAAADLAARLTPLVQRSAERHDGKVVKWLGDGVMFHFRDPNGGVLAALEMVEAIPAAGLPPAHVGLHTGPVVFEGGDYFGRTVNLAARIGAHAAPGQVLVTQEIVDRAGSDGLTFESVGAVELKGVAEPVLLHAVTR